MYRRIAYLVLVASLLLVCKGRPLLHGRQTLQVPPSPSPGLESSATSSFSTATASASASSAGQCLQCTSEDSATCSSFSDSQLSAMRSYLVSNCGFGFDQATCCGGVSSEEWKNYIPCICAGKLAGLDAFVSIQDVVNTCGCPATQNTAATTSLGRSAAVGTTTTEEDVLNQITFEGN